MEKILIVDDEPEVRKSFAHFLGEHGYDPATAGNALEAIRLCRRGDVAAVVCDFHMPEMNGAELLKQLRADHPGVPVVMMSGVADMRTALDLLKKEAFDFLSKPVSPYDLLEALGRALEHSASSREGESERYRGSLEVRLPVEYPFVSELTIYRPLDDSSERSLLSALRTMVHDGSLREICIFNLRYVDYINNIGLNHLIEAKSLLKQTNHRMVLVEVREQVHRYLKMLGYLEYFQVVGSMHEAYTVIISGRR